MMLARALLCVLWMAAARAAEAPHSEPQAPQSGPQAPLSLTLSQQQAVGIRIEHPLPLSAAPAIDGYGTVLDPVALGADAGRMESTAAAAAAAAAEATRLEHLYRHESQASLRALEAARAQSVEAEAAARAARLAFRSQWGPLASWSAPERRSLLGALGAGRQMLMRADVPGRAIEGALGQRALVEVDGVNLTARVLGSLPRTDPQSQSAGWLLQLERALPGLGPGARALVRLQAMTPAVGLLVPAAALLYAEEGTYVYRQVRAGGADTFRYTAVRVRPLARVGSAWLVDGLARADQIVVQGAGVLWSLEGLGSVSAAEEEHD